MSLIDFSYLSIFLVFAHLSESRVVILQDYNDDESFVVHPVDTSVNEGTEPKQEAISISTPYRPKKMRSSKKAILQYGRHVYHFDNFEDLKELRSKIFELKKPLEAESFSYDYADINDWRAIDSAKDGELLILPVTPLQFCDGEDCAEDRKMFRKYDDHKDWKRKKKQVKYIKRFLIVDNRHQTIKEPKRARYDSTENNHKKQKTTKSKKHENKKKKQIDSSESEKKKKKQVHSSESMDSKKLSSKSWKSDKEKKYSLEKNREIIKKPKKKYDSIEDWTKESKSIENISKNKKKKYDSSDETSERKTIAVQEDYFMQGNKIFHSKDRKKKKWHDEDRRRRLQYFLPKRYHWEPEEIHELGYFWFNGPKGLYPAPKPL